MNMRLTNDVFKWVPNTEAMEAFSKICKDKTVELPSSKEEGLNFIQFMRMVEKYGICYGPCVASGLFVSALDYISDHSPICWIGLIGDPVSYLTGGIRIVVAENESAALSSYDNAHTDNTFILGRLVLLGDENESTDN